MGINVLSPEIYNKISAGEVVERPAFIIKELVENSVDAGSTSILIEIENGGISKIRVSDNGCGIAIDDLQKAFLPHATSKITTEKDLYSIKTLGFRGEALASIGAVSKAELISKPANQDSAGVVTNFGGLISTPSITSATNGTTIVVKDLFYNVPARAKFLKKPKTEEAEITNLVTKFILANPCVSIKYVIDGKVKYFSSGNGMQDALYVVYGKQTLENSIYFENDFGYVKLYGYLGKPEIAKPNKTYGTILLNNRYIINSTISTAIFNAYGETLMKRQFPFYVVYVDLDYSMVDVNVHPNKMEVRFENSSDIYVKVFECVNKTLNNINYTKSIAEQNEEQIKSQDSIQNINDVNLQSLPTQIEVNVSKQNEQISKPDILSTEQVIVDYNQPLEEQFATKEDPEYVKERRELFRAMSTLHSDNNGMASGVSIGSKLLSRMQEAYNKANPTPKKPDSEQTAIKYDNEFVYKNFRVIGVFLNTYVLIEQEDNLLIVDQHAGHERLLYNEFINKLSLGTLAKQNLLIPYIFNCNSIELDFLTNHLKELNDLGFEIEEFGDETIKVNAVPSMLHDINISMFLEDILKDVKSEAKISAEDVFKDKIATLACRSAVKGGDKLSDAEIDILLTRFGTENTKLLCPHGRPVVIKIDKTQIEKWFKRIV